MERSVLPQSRKFPELGATTDAPIEPVDPIEKAVRELTLPSPEPDEPAASGQTTA
jgi:hypothetical protein